MTFASVKQNAASSKITLVRIMPTFSLPHPTYSSYWTDNGDGTYQTSLLDYTFKNLYKCGSSTYSKTLLTRATTTSLNSDEWYYDDASKLLKIKPTGVITNYVFIADFYIFLSSAGNIVTYEDPEDSNTSLRDWLPISKSYPSNSESIENVTEGVLTINTTSLSIIDDSFISKYINCDKALQVSFNKKEIKSWIALDDVSNIIKFFSGTTSNFRIDRNSIYFDIKNSFSYLVQKATLIEAPNDAFAYWTLGQWASLYPEHDGKAIRLVMGSVSPMDFKSTVLTGVTNPLLPMPKEKTLQAVCTNYSKTISTSTNREWGCCRVWNVTDLYIGTPITAVDNTNPNYTRLTISSGSFDKFEIGDSIELRRTSFTTYYVQIYQKDSVNRYLYVTKNATINTNWQPPNPIQRIACVVIEDNTNDANSYYPLVGRDYTFNETTMGTYTRYCYITFTNNFESSLSMATLDPKIHKVSFRIRPSGSGRSGSKPGTVLYNLLNLAGCPTDSTSYDDLDTAMQTYCSFAIPTYDEEDYGNYYDYVQKVLSSCFAYIYNSSLNQIKVARYSAPSSTSVLTDSEIMPGSFGEDISYDDILYQLICYNEYAKNPLASQTLTNYSAKYVHGVDTVTRFVHVLEDITNTITALLNYRSYPKKTIKIETKHENLDSLVGDDYDISTKNCVKTGKIIAIDKDQSSVRLILDTFGD